LEDKYCLGLDFGGVILPSTQSNSAGEENFLDAKLELAVRMIPTEGCFESLKKLSSQFLGKICIISKATPEIRRKTWEWIRYNEFTQRTGIEPAHIRFCRDRRGKIDLCKELGVSHYIDDQIAVLDLLEGTVSHRYLFSNEERTSIPDGIIRVYGWDDAVVKIGSEIN